MVPYVEDDTEGPDISEGTSKDGVEQNGVSGGAPPNGRPEGTRSPDSISSSEWQMLVSILMCSGSRLSVRGHNIFRGK